MSGIAGIVRLSGAPLASDSLPKMIEAMAYWGLKGVQSHQTENGGLAYFHTPTTPEAFYESQPYQLPGGEWLVVVARLDNRGELLETLQIDSRQAAILSDGALVVNAYLRWGERVVEQLYGDWSFAVWNPAIRRLFLARDQLGNTSLYYSLHQSQLAFASSSKAILALDPSRHVLNELYVAQMILSWPAANGPHSIYRDIQRLPPAHTLVTTAAETKAQLYWRMEDVQMLPLRTLDEAVEGFLFHFDRAVQSRLRGSGAVATTLSGGLDSGSVTVTAASLLAAADRKLVAYTSVPVSEELAGNAKRFGDEWELASASAAFAAIDRHLAVDARETTPLMGMQQLLSVHESPVHAAGNGYWMVNLLHRVQQDQIAILLTGQGGNATISWRGFATSRPPGSGTPMQQARDLFARHALLPWQMQLNRWKRKLRQGWLENSLVNADLVRRTHAIDLSLREQMDFMHIESQRTPLEQRFAVIKPGRNKGGGQWHELGSAFGIEVRDPTQDIRLTNYCLGIPDHLFHDHTSGPTSGMDRMVIRQAMAGRLPDAVRLNRMRGLQAADLVARLRSDRDELTRIIADFANGPAASFLNLDNLNQSWALVQGGDSQLQHKAALLLRAVMAGLFVEQPPYPRTRSALPFFSTQAAILQS